jgi:hypothetical protein
LRRRGGGCDDAGRQRVELELAAIPGVDAVDQQAGSVSAMRSTSSAWRA